MIRLFFMVMCVISLQAATIKAVVFDYTGVVGVLSPKVQADERVLGLVRQLRVNGYRVGLLSNLSKRTAERVKKEKFIKLFDPALFSYQIGAMKPDRKAYLALVDRLGLKPDEILFIDDSLVNVEGAKSVGLRAIHYTSFDNLIESLTL